MKSASVLGFLAKRVVIWLLIYAALVAIRPWVGEAYGTAFRAFGRVLSEWVLPHGVVRFEHKPDDYWKSDTEAILSSPRAEKQSRGPMNSWYMGYAPTAIVVSLVLATPLPRPRRFTALAWGAVLCHAYIAIRLILWMLSASIGAEFGWIQSGSFPHSAFRVAYTVITNSMAGAYLIPVFIWAVVAVRWRDIDDLVAKYSRQP